MSAARKPSEKKAPRAITIYNNAIDDGCIKGKEKVNIETVKFLENNYNIEKVIFKIENELLKSYDNREIQQL